MAKGKPSSQSLVKTLLLTMCGQFSFVEFENGADLKTAVEKLDKREFKGATVHCSQDVSAGISL